MPELFYCKVSNEYLSLDLFGNHCWRRHKDLAVKCTLEQWKQKFGNKQNLISSIQFEKVN